MVQLRTLKSNDAGFLVDSFNVDVFTPVEMAKSLISVLNAVTRDIYQKLGFLMLISER